MGHSHDRSRGIPGPFGLVDTRVNPCYLGGLCLVGSRRCYLTAHRFGSRHADYFLC
jgi:hypothetical protein